MKAKLHRLKFIKILLSILFLINFKVYSQDLIKLKKGNILNCDVTAITKDTIFLNKEVNGKIVKTYLLKEIIEDIEFNFIKELKEDHDTSSYYTLTLDDETLLTGKIIDFDDKTIKFDDNNLGILTINAYSVKIFKKENSDVLYLIKLKDGNQLYGKIVERRKSEIDFQTKTLGKVTVPVANIKKMTVVNEGRVENGQYWFPNPNNTRYYYGPTAFNLKAREAYYQNVYFVVNSANYGVTDHFSIGGGIIIPFAVYVTPKFNFKISEKFYAGGGILLGVIPGPSALGIAYGITTFGTDEHNFTLGSGWGFIENEFADRPIIMLSGMTRISKRVALVSENWMVPFREYDYDYTTNTETSTYSYYGIFSYGLRVMWEKITIDIAFVNTKDFIEFMPIGIPYVDFVYKFGK